MTEQVSDSLVSLSSTNSSMAFREVMEFNIVKVCDMLSTPSAMPFLVGVLSSWNLEVVGMRIRILPYKMELKCKADFFKDKTK